MRAKKHGVLSAKLFNQLAGFDDLGRVEADGWLVQNQHSRVMQQRIGQAEALTISLGQVADRPTPDGFQPAAL